MRRLAAMLLFPVLLAGLLAGCGGSSASDQAVKKGLPKVTGDYGTKPKVEVSKGKKPPAAVTSAVLKEGDGPKVAKGDLLVADYLGQIYGSKKVFDNSYDRGQPAAFPIGVGQVIPGWDKTLVGVKAGSRVVMVVPPGDGYGPQGNPNAGIKGTDSLVFVVDVISSYGKQNGKSNASAPTPLPSGMPQVSGALGSQPKVTVPKGTAPPKAAKATVVATGKGQKVEKNKLVVVEYEAVSWTGQPLDSTWRTGVPQGFPVGVKGQTSPFDQLVGVPVGSRVLLVLPAQPGSDPKKESIAVAIDVVAQHGPSKES